MEQLPDADTVNQISVINDAGLFGGIIMHSFSLSEISHTHCSVWWCLSRTRATTNRPLFSLARFRFPYPQVSRRPSSARSSVTMLKLFPT